jgi:ABC-type Mn2+/Zn2+ transport system ATPase subunit
MYERLKKGPVFGKKIAYVIPRNPLVEEIKKVITPAEEDSLYPLIIGEHGTGKTSLIKLAVDGMDEPKGVVYVDIPLECDSGVGVINEDQNALGWSPDQVIDSKDRKYSSSFQ